MSRTACALLLLLAVPSAPACRGAEPAPTSRPIARELEREFQRDLTATWRAAVSAVHAAGLAVPEEARLTDAGGRIDVGDLRLRVEPAEGGGSIVGARFLGYPIAEREGRARALLDDIARRLD